MMNWKNELGVIRPELGARVKAFFTERVGGVSSGPWGGIDGIMGLWAPCMPAGRVWPAE